jgi:hypothetical protein
VLWFDVATGECKEYFSAFEAPREIGTEGWSLDFRRGGSGRRSAQFFATYGNDEPDGTWKLQSLTHGSRILISPFHTKGARELYVDVDGYCKVQAGPEHSAGIVLSELLDGVIRRRLLWPPATFYLDPDAKAAAVDVTIPFGGALYARGMTIRLR